MSGCFERIDAQGNRVWLEATYNPILDDQGQVYKVIKFASDITARVVASQQAASAAADTSRQTSEIKGQSR